METLPLAPVLRIKAHPTATDLRDAADLADTLPVLVGGARRARDSDSVRCRLEQALWAVAIRADVPIGVHDTMADVAVKLHTWHVLSTEVAQAVWAVVEAQRWDRTADRLAAHLMLRARYG
ncbi:MAG TPA: hypothetical protein VFA83_06615 [Acidimicrobiales bacterium]|nr:hypothetical protein [Acidimicrobiales bacterium]